MTDGNAKALTALFVGAHPDDVEIGCGGTILRLVAAGHRVVVVDATAGEKGSRGTAQTRAAECAAASTKLGIHHRQCLGLPDTDVTADTPSVTALVRALREHRPDWLFGPVAQDIHPDHAAVAEITNRAWFFAGVKNFAPECGEPFRPQGLLRYPGNDAVTPDLCVDIADLVEQKRETLLCYGTQVNLDDASHIARRQDLLDRVRVRDEWSGHQIATAAAEPYVSEGPVPMLALARLFGP